MRRVGSLLACGILCSIANAAVIDDGPAPPDLRLYERWGALRARPRVQLFNLGWDSNVFNSTENSGDYRATLAPGLEGLLLFGDQAFLRFDSEARYTAYADSTDLNYLDLLNTARITFPLGRFAPYVGGEYDRVRQTPVDLNDIRPVYITERAEVGTYIGVGKQTSVELAYDFLNLKHEDDDFDQRDNDIAARLDRVERVRRATVRHDPAGRTEVSFEASYAEIDFSAPNVAGNPAVGRNSTAFRLLPGVTIGQGGPLRGRVELGYAELNYDRSLLPGYSGAVGQGDLRYQPVRAATFEFHGGRQVDFSASTGNNYYVYDHVRVNTLYFVTSIVGVELDVERGKLQFPITAREDDLTGYLAGVRFLTMKDALGRKVEYRVKVGRRERVSSEAFRDRTRGVVGIDAIFGY